MNENFIAQQQQRCKVRKGPLPTIVTKGWIIVTDVQGADERIIILFTFAQEDI